MIEGIRIKVQEAFFLSDYQKVSQSLAFLKIKFLVPLIDSYHSVSLGDSENKNLS